MNRHGISLSVGRKNDLRFKLSKQDIVDIKKSREKSPVLAERFGVSRSTIDYYRRPEYQAAVKEKNRKHRRDWGPKDNENKQRRRDLTRGKVREYNALQIRLARAKAHPKDFCRRCLRKRIDAYNIECRPRGRAWVVRHSWVTKK